MKMLPRGDVEPRAGRKEEGYGAEGFHFLPPLRRYVSLSISLFTFQPAAKQG